MHGQRLSARPGVLHDRCRAHVHRLLQHVQLAQPVDRRWGIGRPIEKVRVLVTHILHVAQPVVDEPELLPLEGGAHAAAAVVAADDDVLDLQQFHRELHHRQAVEVGVDHQVGDIAVHEQLAWQQADDVVGRHPRVRAADPQVLGRLQPRQAREEAGLDLVTRLQRTAQRMLARQEIRWLAAPENPPPGWPANSRREVFLFFKEALANVVRHARARRVELRAQVVRGEFVLTVSDDGVGIDPARRRSGLGLRGIEERVKELFGTMTVGSAAGQGTTLAIQLPLPAAEVPLARAAG